MKSEEKDMHSEHKLSLRNGVAASVVTAGLALALGTPVAAFADELQSGSQEGEPVAQTAHDTSAQEATSQSVTSGQEQQGATAKKTVAPSGSGTYEKADLGQVTVTYVDTTTGRQIAPAYRKAVQSGASWSAASPSVEGYVLEDASQATVSGTGTGRDVSIMVRYRRNVGTYRVVYERQVNGGGYVTDRVETKSGTVGATVSVAPVAPEGYVVPAGQEFSAKVTADGNATITVRYDLVNATHAVYFSTDGSYVAPVTGYEGDKVTKPADPTRAGYTFAGWDTNGDGVADSLPATMPGHDVNAVALWTPAQATYQVRYWAARSGTNEQKFDLVKTETRTGKTESDAQYDRNGVDTRYLNALGTTYRYYKFDHATSAKIAGDGSTAIDVYYGFKDVLVYLFTDQKAAWQFYDAKCKGTEVPQYALDHRVFGKTTTKVRKDENYYLDTAATLAKNRELVGKDAPKNLAIYMSVQGISVKDGGGSQDDGRFIPGTRFGQDAASCDLYYILYGIYTNSTVYKYYLAPTVVQNLDGTYDEAAYTNDLTKWGSYTSTSTHGGFGPSYPDDPKSGVVITAYRVSTNAFDGDPSHLTWGEWLDPSTAPFSRGGYWWGEYRNGGWATNNNNVAQARARRKSFSIAYYSNGQKLSLSSTYLYGQPLTSAMLPTPEAPDGSGLEFAGWLDKDGNPVDGTTMPVGGLNLYARWKYPDVHVTFEPGNGDSNTTAAVAWRGKATRPTDPVRDGYTFVGWYYTPAADGSGTSATPIRFSFDMSLEKDVTLRAAWAFDATPTTYRVVYVDGNGNELSEETRAGYAGQSVLVEPADESGRGWPYAGSLGRTVTPASDAARNVYKFLYSRDASYTYVIHCVDEDGNPVTPDRVVPTPEALLDVTAPKVAGWHVEGDGEAYVSEDGTEWTFVYVRDKAPTEPGRANSNGGAARVATLSSPRHMAPAAAPRHMAKSSVKSALPKTGDETPAVGGIAAAGLLALLVGTWKRRKA